jgi:hypothetical protein
MRSARVINKKNIVSFLLLPPPFSSRLALALALRFCSILNPPDPLLKHQHQQFIVFLHDFLFLFIPMGIRPPTMAKHFIKKSLGVKS